MCRSPAVESKFDAMRDEEPVSTFPELVLAAMRTASPAVRRTKAYYRAATLHGSHRIHAFRLRWHWWPLNPCIAESGPSPPLVQDQCCQNVTVFNATRLCRAKGSGGAFRALNARRAMLEGLTRWRAYPSNRECLTISMPWLRIFLRSVLRLSP